VWLVSTVDRPSSNPACPRCDELGRLVPGAYYSDGSCPLFRNLEEALHRAQLRESELSRLTEQVEAVLPGASDAAVEEAYRMTAERLRLGPELERDSTGIGPRAALRMLVTIANAQLHATPRESGLLKIAPPIAGLFDPLPKGKGPKGNNEPSATS